MGNSWAAPTDQTPPPPTNDIVNNDIRSVRPNSALAALSSQSLEADITTVDLAFNRNMTVSPTEASAFSVRVQLADGERECSVRPAEPVYDTIWQCLLSSLDEYPLRWAVSMHCGGVYIVDELASTFLEYGIESGAVITVADRSEDYAPVFLMHDIWADKAPVQPPAAIPPVSDFSRVLTVNVLGSGAITVGCDNTETILSLILRIQTQLWPCSPLMATQASHCILSLAQLPPAPPARLHADDPRQIGEAKHCAQPCSGCDCIPELGCVLLWTYDPPLLTLT